MDDAKGPPSGFFDMPPTPTPPTIEKAVQEHLDVLQALHGVQRGVTSLQSDVGRLANTRTTDRIMLERMDSRLSLLEGRTELILSKVEGVHSALLDLVKTLRK